MRRPLALLLAGWAALSAGCSSVVNTVLYGSADFDDRRRAAEVRDREVTSKNVLHWTDRAQSLR